MFDVAMLDRDQSIDLSKAIYRNYHSFNIQKSNGKLRSIDAPSEKLKGVQSQILYNMLYKIPVHENAVGFVPGINVIEGAGRHLNKETLLCIDLKNFFPTITLAMVKKAVIKIDNILQNKNEDYTLLSESEVLAMSRILTYKGVVPQGAPTSPMLANIITFELDEKLTELAEDNNMLYTRYADDISFSHDEKNYDIFQHINRIKEFIQESKLIINDTKTRVMRRHKRQVVTGVVVNDKLSVPKWKWRNFKAQVHNYIRDNTVLSTEEYQKVRGYAEWLNCLNSVRGEKIINMLQHVAVH